jgi:hypothetical protein
VLGKFATDGINGSASEVQHTFANYWDLVRSSCWPMCQPDQP